jgi:hypothetical protein
MSFEGQVDGDNINGSVVLMTGEQEEYEWKARRLPPIQD